VTKPSDFSDWLAEQVGKSRADVLAAAKGKAQEAKDAVKMTQKGGRAVRGGVTMQMRAQVSAASKADSRIRAFLKFVAELKKRPAGVTLADWTIYEQIAEAWEAQGDLSKEDLQRLFGRG